MADPILKWAGGKRQLLSDIKRMFPNSWDNYHEPFLGGGAVVLSLQSPAGTVNDLNSALSNFYQVVKRFPDELIAENKDHLYDRDYYNEVREEYNSLSTMESLTHSERIRKASLLLYLNRTGYNGLYRENSDGEFNVPFGDHSNPNFVQSQRIKHIHHILQELDILNEDFEYVQETATEGDLVYFDPPYKPVSETADFTQYQAEGFDQEDQQRLCEIAQYLDTQNVSVIISNSPPVAELYEDLSSFMIESVSARRSINSDSDNRDPIKEILITNIPPSHRAQTELSQFS
ncbi:DNA adenine methylase [Halosimplex pelagicum]|uniref:site-specific DNA-methyltransferase (adenine-specific) n=1 Tax=Halosimplex pelagicum TaxID=869886 RepID=A0A7D5PDP8_9EURY|nr:DNA adenine methylase [Halosimplex pelagicum]QLH84805.1 DNA adenine methylase [Halosimplex pelagicum]